MAARAGCGIISGLFDTEKLLVFERADKICIGIDTWFSLHGFEGIRPGADSLVTFWP
jgi:hypothetical protein